MRFLKLISNKLGRDFVIGDIHGCYNALMWLLDKVKFDPRVDRLFSVGDLIDRGPDSERCLQLIFEPWFFMVRGNHENMFCDAVNNITTFMHRSDYFNEQNGGAWTRPWFIRNAPELSFWEKKLAALPYVIEVQGDAETNPFWVVHAELRATKSRLTDENIEQHLATSSEDELVVMQWGRKIAKRLPVVYPPQFPGPVYCGHTPNVNPPDVYLGHWNLDGGAGKWAEKGPFSEVCLTMVCHQTGKVYRKDVSGQVHRQVA